MTQTINSALGTSYDMAEIAERSEIDPLGLYHLLIFAQQQMVG